MDLRIEFMNRMARGETVAELCRAYGISRKTGDKFRNRFLRMGTPGLQDQSRAPKVIPHRTPPELAELIVGFRRKHPSWGAKKVKSVLEGELGRQLPAASTVQDIMKRAGLVEPRKSRPRTKPRPTGLREAGGPNEIWCIDYKGQFRMGDRSYCYPLTITDQFSRYILACEGMYAISDEAARDACEEVFRTHGLPLVMRSDNGAPFASTGLASLTKLSAYWMRLGLILERIRPGQPQENGRHERMHRTLKAETARPARSNLLQQQERFDEFVAEFNTERPHESLGMKRPADVHQLSSRPYPTTLPDPEYLGHDDTIRVNQHGFVYFRRSAFYFSAALAGQHLGLREEEDGRWLVTFLDLDLGHLGTDNKLIPIQPASPPAGA